jgi:hypothetical protein
VWPSLVARLRLTTFDKTTMQNFCPNMQSVSTLRYAEVKCLPTLFTQFCLHMILLIQVHAAFVYVVYSGLDVIMRDSPIGLLN